MRIVEIEEKTPLVVAIAGTAGAGKTRLVQRLSALLGDAVCLYFDRHRDYRFPNGDVFNEWTWAAQGCDPADWSNPGLAENVRRLKAGYPVELAESGGPLSPTDVILVEEPFGRSRPEIAPLIDYVVLVSVPLEIALARILERSLRTDERRTTDPQAYLNWLERYLSSKYPNCDRLCYEAVVTHAGANCDLQIDGMQSLEVSAQQVIEALQARFPDRWPGPSDLSNPGSRHQSQIGRQLRG